ncbi:transcriptional regulator [Sphingobium jiangsuense]|uniref:DNA-binding MarR family transcriptional regulator n=1 Tax=Sphingobium jiangsuense TaxID=870476 RepID=A0A7W6FPC7_9SPHN|nr:MarR family transcriptional regulator [Sphingobium jiangsuense]MBB3925680.1 DNA-binding MarR family transcriptional regulator [Sphingobium jiangsuense]GLT00350.1 transcriptional regulator [Sphingobium jiangsuense]
MDDYIRGNEEMPGHLARRFQQIAVAIFQSEVGAAGCDLTPVQYAALVAIRGRPRIDQITLAGEIALDRTTTTGVVDRLESKGLITRQVNAKDRRARELAVTPEGQAMLDRIAPAVNAAQALMVRGLSGEEAARLTRLLRKAIEANNELSRAPKRG